MNFGLVLSFCNKRWTDPVELADLCASLSIDKVQFSWDLVDPLWERSVRDKIARGYSEAFKSSGISLTTCFSGMSAYAYPNLLAEDPLVRQMGVYLVEQAIDMCSVMEIPEIGMALGCMSDRQARDPQGRYLQYVQLKEELIKLCAYARKEGVQRFSVEPTPVYAEIPNSAAESLRLMEELNGQTEIPVQLMLDVGHILCPPFNSEPANILYWLDVCGTYVSAIHLQQCDGKMDRHWGFDTEGIVRAEDVVSIAAHPTMHGKTQYLECCPAFETPNEQVLKQISTSLAWLRENCKFDR